MTDMNSTFKRGQMVALLCRSEDALIDHATELSIRLDHTNAKLDALMMEYCPDEMTSEQVKAWEKHQGRSNV